MTNRWSTLALVLLASFSLAADDKGKDHEKGLPKPPGGAVSASAPAPAKPSGLCDKLYRFSCAPGEYDDGTGVGRSKNLVIDKIEEIKKEEAKNYAERFKAELTKTPRLRAAAIAAFELNDSPDCEELESETDEAKAKARRDRCDKTLTDALAEFSLDRLFAGPGQDFLSKVGFSLNLRGTDFLLNNPGFKRVEAELGTKIREKLVDKKTAETLEKEIFPEVRDSLAALVDKLVLNAKDKKKIVDKIKSIEFGGTDCTKLKGSDESSVIGSLIPNAYYNALENTFRYCNGYLMQSTSRFQMVHVIAHELSHAFDPCQIAMDMEGSAVPYTDPTEVEQCEKEYPISGIFPCLRSEESVGASRRKITNDPLLGGYGSGESPDPIFLPSPEDLGIGGKKGEGKKPSLPLEPKKHFPGDGHDHSDAAHAFAIRGIGSGAESQSPSPFCLEEDQVTEAFADRMADEILPDYIEKHHATLTVEQKRIGYSNVYRGACPRKGVGELPTAHDVHPDTQKRVDRSLLVHPKVRKQMGCQEAPPEGRKFCPLVAADVPKADPTKKQKALPDTMVSPKKTPRGGY